MKKPSPDFQRCLDRGRLAKMPAARHLVEKELKVAEDDFAEADAGLKRGGFKWSTIQSYYSMFHAARALLYTRGYREKSHFCLTVALREFFVRQGTLADALVVELEDARSLREDADYRASFSEAGARQSLKAARRFLTRARELAAEWKASELKIQPATKLSSAPRTIDSAVKRRPLRRRASR